ncbi:MAG: hypothetical protein ACI88C_000014 [Acidimicrobiales bacterium]|jgi:hypothetical protein
MTKNFTTLTGWDFFKAYRHCSRKNAAALIGDRRKGYTVLVQDLCHYAANRATAATSDVQGVTDHYNMIAANILDRLPADLHPIAIAAGTIA